MTCLDRLRRRTTNTITAMAVIRIAATIPAIKGTESGADAEDAFSLLASFVVSLTVLEVAILLVGDNVDDRVGERK